MAIRTKDRGYSDKVNNLLRKANQHWEMAGLARQDRDKADALHHTEEARRYTELARQAHLAGE